MNKLWYLSQLTIFEALTMEEIEEIDRLNTVEHFTWIPKHTLVQTPRTTREGLFFVKEGKLRLYKLNEQGKQFTLSILGKGNIYGELHSFALGTKGIYVETIEPSLLCSMSENQFERLMQSQPKLAVKFLNVLSERLKEREEQLEQLALHRLKDRLLHLLFALSAKFGAPEDGYIRIDLPLSHQEMAYMLGVTREAVSGVVNELVKEGRIRTGRMTVAIAVNEPKLQLKGERFASD